MVAGEEEQRSHRNCTFELPDPVIMSSCVGFATIRIFTSSAFACSNGLLTCLLAMMPN